ncbi:anhydro-N-acetylmuramic acid kinase [Flavobacterium selenitireducens]|uniref:anhydro-N-acetylmuramic acid kinase n=1 Tax=Flavobacterium selenitireducens TaxID=2722704 RepID=UPI00168BD16C|nr:anhydro-N-acetylmuramic acid kinase [Flavobacterium selenitireducens]
MPKESYNVIGVMSGTSLDGIDVAHVGFEVTDGKWAFEIRESETIPYSPAWVETLKTAVTFGDSELEKLNSDYTLLLGNAIRAFIDRHAIQNLDAVCSHGHTILHQPNHGITLQIGNLPEIAQIVGHNVICDFRVDDVKLGGQGAPLVPIGDRLLFPDYDYCLNLGGFSNVSFENNGVRVAFDISPVNTVLNFYANRLGFDFDDKGNLAKSGAIDYELLHELNNLDFYARSFPKSLGFEFVKTTVLPLIERFEISDTDKMRSFTEHIAVQTASALPKKNGKMLITGGGAYNEFLISRIQEQLSQIVVDIPGTKILEFKEALIFGLLGVLRSKGERNVLSSVTGAAHDHSSGKIHTN